jgi:hypothetical protein
MNDFRLGDVLDDYCVKCRRLTNHSIVSLIEAKAAKVRCRTCYSDHDYRNEQIPPSKKDLKKAALFNQVLAGVTPPAPMAEPLAAEAFLAEPTLAEPFADGSGMTEPPQDGPAPVRPKSARKKV